MRFRPRPPAQRRFCGVMLLVWLFAVLSGTVNACVLTERSGPAHAEHTTHTPHVAVALHDHAHDHPGASPAGLRHVDEHLVCHKFCKDQSASLTPFKNVHDQDFHPVLLALGSALLPDAWAAQPLPPAVEHRPPAHGPPVHIRLLRLTL